MFLGGGGTIMLVLSFLHIKLKMECSNVDVDPMTCAEKDSDHVTCFVKAPYLQGTGLVEHILPLS